MENHTSFDLSAAIRQWRANLAESPDFRADDLDELESHLRDSVSELEARGLSAGEAFAIGTRRIGPGPGLAAEFAIVNGREMWIDRLLWMLLGAVSVAAVKSLFESMLLMITMTTSSASAPLLFLYGLLSVSPVILAALALRSLIRAQGAVPSALTNLLRRPLTLSAGFFSVGLLALVLKLLALSSMTGNVFRTGHALQREALAGSAVSLVGWAVAALCILALASRRLRPARA